MNFLYDIVYQQQHKNRDQKKYLPNTSESAHLIFNKSKNAGNNFIIFRALLPSLSP